MKKDAEQLTASEIERRRDEAVRRALNTPPKPYKESKVGKDKNPTSSRPGKA